MALDLAAEIQRQGSEDGFLVDASGGEPLVLDESLDAFLKVRRELTVPHPLLDVPPLDSPFFASNRD